MNKQSVTADDVSARMSLHDPSFLSQVAALVHQHRSHLLHYARKRGLHAEDALDAVQDSFVSFLGLTEAPSLAHNSEDSVKLLTVILKHHILNRTRLLVRRTRANALLETQQAVHDSETSEALIAHAQELLIVHNCMQRMNRIQRQVVMLSLLDEQPNDHIARVLGISDSYVRVLLHRAREHLRHCEMDSELTKEQ